MASAAKAAALAESCAIDATWFALPVPEIDASADPFTPVAGTARSGAFDEAANPAETPRTFIPAMAASSPPVSGIDLKVGPETPDCESAEVSTATCIGGTATTSLMLTGLTGNANGCSTALSCDGFADEAEGLLPEGFFSPLPLDLERELSAADTDFCAGLASRGAAGTAVPLEASANVSVKLDPALEEVAGTGIVFDDAGAETGVLLAG